MSDMTLGVAGEALDKYWERMRDGLVVIAAVAALIACTPDTNHRPIFLPPPYNTWPPAPPGTPNEPGRPVVLNGRQQESVVTGVLKWMKEPASVQFLGIKAVQNSRGWIIVCGEVNGRNSAGNVTISPFVGVLMGPNGNSDFVVVGIGSSDREQVEVTSLCRASGLYSVQ